MFVCVCMSCETAVTTLLRLLCTYMSIKLNGFILHIIDDIDQINGCQWIAWRQCIQIAICIRNIVLNERKAR